jgi:hypothetical protein
MALTAPPELTSRPAILKLLFFYDEVAIDADNILKPIQDALIGIILQDDAVVTDVEIRRRWLRSAFTLGTVSPTLAAGLALEREFVYVFVGDAPPQDVLT